MDSTLLELAAHPLNSVNPPPKDLPDLVDSLLVNNSQIQNKISRCQRVVNALGHRVRLIHQRLVALNEANPQLYSRSQQATNVTTADDAYKVFQAQSCLLQEMMRQLHFLQSKHQQESELQLERLITAHHHVFREFLGEQHDHAEHDEAETATRTCVVGCEWYLKHGPYEWTKQPYTLKWWTEMNATNWDWIRVHEHIQNLILEGQQAITNIDMLHDNMIKFLPVWIWYDSLAAWSVHASVVTPAAQDRQAKRKLRLWVQYVRNEPMKQQERARREEQQREKWLKEGMSYAEATAKPVELEISSVGVQNMNPRLVFDAELTIPDWNAGGQLTGCGSWLTCYGYRRWVAELHRRSAAASKNHPPFDAANTSKS